MVHAALNEPRCRHPRVCMHARMDARSHAHTSPLTQGFHAPAPCAHRRVNQEDAELCDERYTRSKMVRARPAASAVWQCGSGALSLKPWARLRPPSTVAHGAAHAHAGALNHAARGGDGQCKPGGERHLWVGRPRHAAGRAPCGAGAAAGVRAPHPLLIPYPSLTHPLPIPHPSLHHPNPRTCTSNSRGPCIASTATPLRRSRRWWWTTARPSSRA